MDTRIKAVVLYSSGEYSAGQVSKMYNVDERTVRKWKRIYMITNGFEALKPEKTGPKHPKGIPRVLEQRIIRLKERYPSWGAKRIKTPI
jgi:transposase